MLPPQMSAIMLAATRFSLPRAAFSATSGPSHVRLPGSASYISARQDTRDEHVILADCRDNSGKVSSEMAYFLDEPDGTPQDVAVVATPDGQAALWASNTTTGLFTDTGVKFTAVLGPQVSDGAYAGTGDNGFNNGGFKCWETYQKDLYTHGNATCSQVYDCNHQTAPASSSSPSPASQPSGELSIGAVVGIAVSISVVALLGVAGAIVFYFRRRARRNRVGERGIRQPETSSAGGLLGFFKKHKPQSSGASTNTWPQSPESPETNLASSHSPKPGTQEIYSLANYMYELDAQPPIPELQERTAGELNGAGQPTDGEPLHNYKEAAGEERSTPAGGL